LGRRLQPAVHWAEGKVQDVLIDHLAEAVLEDALLARGQLETGAADGKSGDDFTVEEDRLPHLGFPADDDDDPRVRFADATEFGEDGQHVQAVLRDGEEAVTAMLAVGADLRPRHLQKVPAQQLHRLPVLLVVVEDVDVGGRGDDDVRPAGREGQRPCVAVRDLDRGIGERQGPHSLPNLAPGRPYLPRPELAVAEVQ
jgi:hypothetical protein